MTRQHMISEGRTNQKDWEAISAYLDDALNTRQRMQLEQRLEKEAELRTALRDLSRTRAVLRSQPRLRAPRNFTLTPQMAGVQTGRSSQPFAFPVLRLASVLATIFFVVVLVGDLVARSAKPAIVAQDNSAPMVGMGGGGAGGPGFGGGVAEVEMEAPAPEEALAVEKSALLTATPASGTDATVAAAIPEAETAPSDRAAENTGQTSAAPAWPVLSVLQVLLALLAVGAGVGAWIVRRSARR